MSERIHIKAEQKQSMGKIFCLVLSERRQAQQKQNREKDAVWRCGLERRPISSTPRMSGDADVVQGTWPTRCC